MNIRCCLISSAIASQGPSELMQSSCPRYQTGLLCSDLLLLIRFSRNCRMLKPCLPEPAPYILQPETIHISSSLLMHYSTATDLARLFPIAQYGVAAAQWVEHLLFMEKVLAWFMDQHLQLKGSGSRWSEGPPPEALKSCCQFKENILTLRD